jgi:hypothetical protein
MRVSRTSQGRSLLKTLPLIGVASTLIGVLGPSGVDALSERQIGRLDTLVFQTPLDNFRRIASRRSGIDAVFDWSTDHCSAPLVGNTGRSFDFTTSCQRHDFAYRNFKKADSESPQRGQLWNSSVRHRIDLQFQRDMRGHCSQRGVTERATCRVWAEVFYRLVRIAGGP